MKKNEKKFRIKLILKITLFLILILYIIVFIIKNPNIFESLFLVKCDNISSLDVKNLNLFFNNTRYSGDIKYWCEITKINPVLSINGDKLIPEISKLANLNFLDLSEKGLIGKIPKELGNLSNLKVLLLNNNTLTGKIPKELGNLINLETLNLSKNFLTGKIPKKLLKINSLNY